MSKVDDSEYQEFLAYKRFMEQRRASSSGGAKESPTPTGGGDTATSTAGAGDSATSEAKKVNPGKDTGAQVSAGGEEKSSKSTSTKRKRTVSPESAGGNESEQVSKKPRAQGSFKEHVEGLIMLYGSAQDIPPQLKHNVASHYAQQYGFPENLSTFSTSPPPSQPVEQPPVEQPAEQPPAEQAQETSVEGEQPQETSTEAPTEQPQETPTEQPVVGESAPTTSTQNTTPLSPRSIFGVPSQ